MRKISFLSFLIASCTVISSANAKHYKGAVRPDAHAPIGVMRDHTHNKGDYMLSYRYELMEMRSARQGSNQISTDAIHNNYMMAPKNMMMEMHMVGLMYGVSDKITLGAMGSFIEKEMEMVNRSQIVSEKSASDIGDTKINASYSLTNSKDSSAQINFGISLPTGSIKRSEDGSRLAYPMQIGSGSYEALPGISYSKYFDNYSIGGQVNAVLPLNTNNAGYKKGNQYNLTSWVSRKVNENASISTRLDYTETKSIEGFDEDIQTTMMMTKMSPMVDPKFSGRKTLNLLIGANLLATQGQISGHRLALEFGVPIYQKVRGIQLEDDYKLTLGWQKSF